MKQERFAGIEAGGTKILCAVADVSGNVLSEVRIATRSPDETFEDIAAFYKEAASQHGAITAAGVASFGPLDLDPASSKFGSLTTTPKPGWAGIDMLGRLTDILGVPTAIDTDVNCAAMAEGMIGAAVGLNRFCYMTVGTGIGVGIVDGNAAPNTVGHSEVGHIRVARASGDDFAGICPAHKDCVEGLACGPAMKARWNASAEDLPADHVAWEYEAHYIASICINLTYTVRPQRIIIGGGVLERSSLYDRVRERFAELANGYALDRYSDDSASFIVAPGLKSPSPGLVGALHLARDKACAA